MLRYKSQGRERQCRNPKARSSSKHDAPEQKEYDERQIRRT